MQHQCETNRNSEFLENLLGLILQFLCEIWHLRKLASPSSTPHENGVLVQRRIQLDEQF